MLLPSVTQLLTEDDFILKSPKQTTVIIDEQQPQHNKMQNCVFWNRYLTTCIFLSLRTSAKKKKKSFSNWICSTVSRSEFLYAVRGCGLGGSVKSPHKESGLFFLQVLYTHCLRVYNMSNVHLSRAKSVNIWPFSPSTRSPYNLIVPSLCLL